MNHCKIKQYTKFEDLVSLETMTKVFFFCGNRDLDHKHLAQKTLLLPKAASSLIKMQRKMTEYSIPQKINFGRAGEYYKTKEFQKWQVH